MTRAIILAAGTSSRLHPLTKKIPKCLLKIGNTTILDYNIDILTRAGVDDIVIVVGHQGHLIEEKYEDKFECIKYPDFDKTNNLYTLNYISKYLEGETIILFSDILVDLQTLKKCIYSDSDFCLLVHRKNILEETMRVVIKHKSIKQVGSHIPSSNADGNFVGISRFTSRASKLLRQKIKSICKTGKKLQEYYTVSLNELVKDGERIEFCVVETPWIEIDTLEDYEMAKKVIFPNIVEL